MRIAAVLVVLLLAACKEQAAKPEPPANGCSSLCFTPCVEKDGDTGLRWVGDAYASETWDALSEGVTVTLADKVRECERRRAACHMCLDRLSNEGVTQ
jgi:hypothetical protein